jgi:hypothetical protein
MSETLLNELRAARPAAPPLLRERVRALAAQEPARAPFLARLDWRRLVLLAPATVAVALVAGTVIGLTRGDVTADERAAKGGGADATAASPSLATPSTSLESAGSAEAPPATLGDTGGIVPPAPGQLQRYEAELRLRVDDVEALSDATKRAQQIALRHGGSVASLQYDAPAAGVGGAQITLRVPTERVQSALSQLSQLGTIVGQRYGIEDLQVQADSLQSQVEAAQRQLAGIQAQLRSATLSDADRAVLQSRLANAREKLTGLRRSLRTTKAEAATATVFLSLTTEELQPGAVGGSRLDDVKDVLAWEGIAALYVLVVAGPIVLLALLVWLALRLLRRRETARLLEQH